MRKKNSFSPIIIILTILAIIGSGLWAVARTKAKTAHATKNFLVVGTNPPFPPFEDKKDANVVGFDMDLAERIAEQLHRNLVIKTLDEFGSVLPELGAGKIDLAASAITITPERKEVVNFSIPYYSTVQAVLATKSSALNNIRTPKDFAGLKVACQAKTTSQTWVEQNLMHDSNGAPSLDSSHYTLFDDMNYTLQSLRLGQIDVILLDKTAADNFVGSHPDLKIAGTIQTNENYGLAVRQGDPDHLLPVINQVIETMQKNGELQKLQDKWLGGGK